MRIVGRIINKKNQSENFHIPFTNVFEQMGLWLVKYDDFMRLLKIPMKVNYESEGFSYIYDVIKTSVLFEGTQIEFELIDNLYFEVRGLKDVRIKKFISGVLTVKDSQVTIEDMSSANLVVDCNSEVKIKETNGMDVHCKEGQTIVIKGEVC